MFSSSSRKIPASLPKFIRYASGPKKRASDKIPVQLLRNFPGTGVKGEIIRVKPAFMRNYLHHQNGAAYITKDQGPRIPVVEKPTKVEVVAKAEKPVVVEAVKTKSKASAGAMSLDELSTLFTTMRSKRSAASSASASDSTFEASTASEDAAFTLAELKGAIPAVYTLQLSDSIALPIGKSTLASIIFNLSGVQVPQTALSISETGKKAGLDAIPAVGDYTLSITNSAEKATVSKTIRVVA
ncbi:hypothetical protein G9P44_004796 [Scheffersomyces stipitis]|nr:hypothetical protein G9P44_004796 [Scheffersomyces stipitis]